MRITTWWKRTYEGLRGAHIVSPVSLSFANFPGSGAVVWCWLVFVFGFFGLLCCVCLCFSGFQGNFCR